MSLQHNNDIYPVALNDNDWAQILNSNREAQDLLSNAIAHHEQYREDDPMKRKGVISQSHQLQAERNKATAVTAGGDHFDDPPRYSEGDNSSDEGHSPGEGKPAPKKAGRKPLTTEPTNKRKAQNRAAQRAFRDRKERYVKSLEERIKELEDMNPKSDSTLAEENMNLKVLVQKLETENYFLKEQSFTFDFPISQPGMYNVAKANNNTNNPRQASLQSNTSLNSSSSAQSSPSPASTTLDHISNSSSSVASSTPQTNVLNKPPRNGIAAAKGLTNEQLPWSPPSSAGDSVPNSPLDNDLSTPEHDSVSQGPYSENAGVVPRFRNSTPEEVALFSSLLDGTGNTYSPVPQASHQPTQASIPTSSSNSFVDYNRQHHQQQQQSSQHQQHQQSQTHLGVANHTPASTLADLSTPSPTLEELVNAPLFGADTTNASLLNFGTGNNMPIMPPMTFEQTQAALFTDYRDPSDPRNFFSGFDDPIETTTFGEDPIGGLFNDQLLDYTNAFNVNASVPSPPAMAAAAAVAAASQSPMGGQVMSNHMSQEQQPFVGKVAEANQKFTLPPLGEDEKAIPCPQAWEHIAKHPNFDDVDIDDLCKELKSKAKCSGHGPVIALSDVDKLMNKLNQE
ncbi:DNA-binding transcription factor yap1 [Gryganskiella cystojenkinii]|nr:DNA-binding transcription factor yap1 [Gryganskiella cystojenkinii]